jgi:hypothetical protein
MRRFWPIHNYFFFAFTLVFCFSCSKPSKYSTPEGYDLNHPVVVKLKDELNEISGIIYYPKDTGIFAISDATGSLYKIFPDKDALVEKWKFGKNADFEDLQLIDSVFYVLSSKGNIVSVKFITKDSMQTSNFDFPDKKSEFEAFYYDSASRKLVLICKDCKDDKKNNVGTSSFDLATQTYGKGPFTIDAKKIESLLDKGEKSKFKPSAAAINPLTQELYIVASVNKILAIADKNGVLQKVYPLNPSIYKQPEGIAFTPSGDLLISNESADEGAANILVIKHKTKAQ